MERMRYAPSPMLATAKPNMKMHLFTLNHDESVCTSALCKLAIDCVIATHCSSQSSSLDAESLYLAFGWVGVERVLFRDGNSMSSGSSASSCRREGRKAFALIAMSNSRSRSGHRKKSVLSRYLRGRFLLPCSDVVTNNWVICISTRGHTGRAP